MGVLQGLTVAPSGFSGDLLAAWKGEARDDRLFFSLRSGGSWSAAVTIPGNSSTGPSLASVGGKVYAAWKGEPDDERLFYSSFDGHSWAAQQTIPGNSSVGPSLAEFGGQLYAAWKGESYDQRLFFSSLGSQGWAPQQQIPGVGSAVGPSLASFDHALYAVWRGENSDQNLYWASFDGHAWSGQAAIGGAGSDIGPSLAVYAGKLYAIWKGIKGDEGLYFASFDGHSWTAQSKIAGVASSMGPAAAGGSNLYALWKGETGDQGLYFSTYDGSSWTAQTTIPGNTCQDPLRILYIPDVHLERYAKAAGDYYLNGGDLCTPPANPAGNQPVTFINLCGWVNANQANLHFQAILCAGDYAAGPGGGSWNLPVSHQDAWQEGLSVALQCGKPFISASGNHDNEDDTPGWYTYSFDQNICHAKISGEPWYVGAWQSDPLPNSITSTPQSGLPDNYVSLSNQAISFANGAQQVLVVVLEFVPRPGAQAWAQNVIAAHPTHDVVLLTHYYLDLTGEPYAAAEGGTGFIPTEPQVVGLSGAELQTWIKSEPRIRLVLSGHAVTTVSNGAPLQPNIMTRTDTNAAGGTTAAIVANYQFTGSGRPDEANPRPCCEVVVQVEIGETSINVRGFNTTLGTELDGAWGYPKAILV